MCQNTRANAYPDASSAGPASSSAATTAYRIAFGPASSSTRSALNTVQGSRSVARTDGASGRYIVTLDAGSSASSDRYPTISPASSSATIAPLMLEDRQSSR